MKHFRCCVLRNTSLFTDIYLKAAVHGGCDLALQTVALRPNLRVLYTTGNNITDKMKALKALGHRQWNWHAGPRS